MSFFPTTLQSNSSPSFQFNFSITTGGIVKSHLCHSFPSLLLRLSCLFNFMNTVSSSVLSISINCLYILIYKSSVHTHIRYVCTYYNVNADSVSIIESDLILTNELYCENYASDYQIEENIKH